MSPPDVRRRADTAGWLRDDVFGEWKTSCPVCQPDGSRDYLAATVGEDGSATCREGCAPALVAARLGLGPLVVTAREFIERPRPPLVPLVASKDGRTILVARDMTFGIAGPSGAGKSYAAYDLAGLLAGPGGDWLGLDVVGGQRVLLVPYPGENTEDDVANRLGDLLPDAARDRASVWDRWEGDEAPVADEAGIAALAAVIAAREIDVTVLDTGSAFFEPFAEGFSVSEGANSALERVRKLSGRRVAFILIAHTRKLDRRAEAPVAEVEEIGGTIVKKFDAAVVIRNDGQPESPRRKVRFAKSRRGPLLPPVIASFPRDQDAPPRLTLVERLSDGPGRPIREGTETERIAGWLAEQDGVQPVSAIEREFGISASTVGRRRDELLALGVVYDRVPGQGNRHAYGTTKQWAALAGEPVTNPSEVPVTPNPSELAASLVTGSNPSEDGGNPAVAQPAGTKPVRRVSASQESLATAGDFEPVTTRPPYGGPRQEGARPDPVGPRRHGGDRPDPVDEESDPAMPRNGHRPPPAPTPVDEDPGAALIAAAVAKLGAVEIIDRRPPCPYPEHRGADWRLARGGAVVCGVCHPPLPGQEIVPVEIEARR